MKKFTPPNLIDPKTKKLIIQTAENVRFVEQSSRSGSTDASIRIMTGILREFADNADLAKAWKHLGFPKQPIVPADIIEPEKLHPTMIVILGGGVDHNPKYSQDPIKDPSEEDVLNLLRQSTGSMRSPVMTMETADGPVAMPPSQSLSLSYRYGHDTPEKFTPSMETPATPGVRRVNLPLDRFFSSTMIYVRGMPISRHDIIKHMAYEEYGVHSTFNGPSTRKDKRAIVAPLLEEIASDQLTFRETLYFLQLSIAQDLVESENIKKFLHAAEKLAAENDN
jgi:hypothetical protein